MDSDFLIRKLKSKADAERSAIAVLDAKTSDSVLKRQLQEASFWLDDVEMFIRSAQTEIRTPAALMRWLAYAEMPLQLAVERRKKIAEYGSHAQSR